MAVITISKKEILYALKRKLSDDELRKNIGALGASVDSLEGDVMSIEIYPNRPDLLSQTGIVRALSSFLELQPGLKKYSVASSGKKVIVEKTLSVWPFAVCGIVQNLKFTDSNIRDIIQVQEKLHQTLLRNRKKGGIGIYPLNHISFPVRFTTIPKNKIKFMPLESTHEMSAKDILEKHPTGKKYGFIIENQAEYPIFIDSKDTIMSMPPVINAHKIGKVTEETTAVFIEATGTDHDTLKIALNIIITMLADMGGSVQSIEMVDKGKKVTSPNLEPQIFPIDKSYIENRLGMKLTDKELGRCLNKMGLDVKKNTILIPAYRQDILHQVDLVEEIAIAKGYDAFKPVIPSVATIAKESPLSKCNRVIRQILLGAGLIEVKNLSLDSKNRQEYTGNKDYVILKNSVSEEFSVLRRTMLSSLLSTLERNKHYLYPQDLFEIGTIFSHDQKTDSSIREEEHIGIVLCDSSVSFTRAKQILDLLCDSLSLQYTLTREKTLFCIDGRTGTINIDNERVGIIGEIAPQVLSDFSLTMPVAFIELSVDKLLQKVVEMESK